MNNNKGRHVGTDRTLQERLDEGAMLIRSGRTSEAQALARVLVEELGDNPEVRFFASDAESMTGNASAAIAQLDALEGAAAKNPRILMRKAELFLHLGQRSQALENVRQALSMPGVGERLICAASKVLIDSRQFTEARDVLLAGHEQNPGSEKISYLLAVAELQLKHSSEALKYAHEVLALQPHNPGALLLRSQLTRCTPEQNHCDELHACVTQAEGNAQLLAVANYALRKEYEDLGARADSFVALVAGADAYRELISYDEDLELASHSDIRSTFTKDRLDSLAPGCDASGPVFIVGMPRTGVSLLESLLSRHKQVVSVGESGDFKRALRMLAINAAPAEVSDAEACLSVDFATLGERYLDTVRQSLESSVENPRIIEVTPHNFLYCGHIFAALPNARIVHMTRDPLDTCYAVYKTLFFGAYGYSYDLDELASYMISYQEHMEHWHKLFPDRILNVAYEDLVRDTSTQARRILEYCGLDWQDDLLNIDEPFHDHSIGAWKHFAEEFAPARERLQEAGQLKD
ncbi:MAG: sulfotransferase [Congregibacter sp.]